MKQSQRFAKGTFLHITLSFPIVFLIHSWISYIVSLQYLRYYTYTVQMIVERHFVPFSATRKSQNTPSKCMKFKNNHSKHCSIERAFNSKLPADDSISPFKPRTTDVHVIPGLMLIMLNLSRQIFDDIPLCCLKVQTIR